MDRGYPSPDFGYMFSVCAVVASSRAKYYLFLVAQWQGVRLRCDIYYVKREIPGSTPGREALLFLIFLIFCCLSTIMKYRSISKKL
ncbi:hypothetical protein V1505DRAFT_366329 [Lipomyces doorenjongii]